MFFNIGRKPDPRFANHTSINKWFVSHDNGWYKTQWGINKGYRCDNSHNANNISIIGDDERASITLKHEAMRGFPLWRDVNGLGVTSLYDPARELERIWSDEQVTLEGISVRLDKYDHIGDIEWVTPGARTQAEAVVEINSQLAQSFIDFATNHKELILFPTGGIDTMLLKSILNASGLFYNEIDREHFEYDQFTNRNIETIQDTHWGYKQIHHWRERRNLVTGGCGDEFLLRGPDMVGLYCAWHDIDLVKLVQENTAGYHHRYYLKDKNIKTFWRYYDERKTWKSRLTTYRDLVYYILNSNSNDHQHWHLGNTITFTPFKNHELTKILLCLEPEVLVQQFLTAQINKEIIRANDPELLDEISEYKNFDTRANLKIK